jgi:2-polyprenyl-3-methyl-5-hydroxy-6-metoxy-1,4-benzoquinol methylase
VKPDRAVPPIAGNFYDKYNSRNPLARFLMNGYIEQFDGLLRPLRREIRSVTEVGCGEGHLAAHIADMHIVDTVRACDSSAHVIRIARDRHRAAPILFYQKSVYDIDQSDSADMVVCCEVLEHLERPQAAIQQLQSVTGKYLLASVPNEPLWRALNMLRLSYLASLGNTPGHVNHWRPSEFVSLLARHFDVVAVRKPLPWVMALCRKR